MPVMHATLEQLQREIVDSLSGLDAEQTQLRRVTDASKWSIQQVLEHLLLTYASTCSVFETRIAKGTPTRARPTVRQRAGQLMLLRIGRFPQGRKAPCGVTPSSSQTALSGAELAEKATGLLMRFDRLAEDAEQLFRSRRSISHQVLGPLSVEQWRRFHLIHGRHHLKQIRAICAAHSE